MVKNFGGNKGKKIARKDHHQKESSLHLSKDKEFEVYAQVIKNYGNNMVEVILIDGTTRKCRIPGKFIRRKRDNNITVGTWLLVGKDEFYLGNSSSGKTMSSSVLAVYNNDDKIKLQNNETSVDWNIFITNDSKTLGSYESETSGYDVIQFSDEKTQEYKDLINSQIDATKSGIINSIIYGKEIDIDDI